MSPTLHSPQTIFSWRHAALKGAALRAGKIVFFIACTTVMVPAVHAASWLAFLLPAMAVAVATVLSFIPSTVTTAPRGQTEASA